MSLVPMDGYEIAWDELKEWLKGEEKYIMIPVGMIREKMAEYDEMYKYR